MKVLITGGAGFIGSALCRRMLDEGHDVTVWDDLSMGSLELVDERALFEHVDVGRFYKEDIRAVEYDVVIHAASIISGPMAQVIRTNVAGVFGVCEAHPLAKHLLLSSLCVYGHPSPSQKDSRFSSGFLVQPFPRQDSLYGTSKFLAEMVIRSYAGESIRLPAVFGSGMSKHSEAVDLWRVVDAIKRSDAVLFTDEPYVLNTFLSLDRAVEEIVRTACSPDLGAPNRLGYGFPEWGCWHSWTRERLLELAAESGSEVSARVEVANGRLIKTFGLVAPDAQQTIQAIEAEIRQLILECANE